VIGILVNRPFAALAAAALYVSAPVRSFAPCKLLAAVAVAAGAGRGVRREIEYNRHNAIYSANHPAASARTDE
jgi:hypothetical protein